MPFQLSKINLSKLTIPEVFELCKETHGRMHRRFITDGTRLYKEESPKYGTALGILTRKTYPAMQLETALEVLKDQVKIIVAAHTPPLEQGIEHLVALSLFLDIFNQRVLVKHNEKAITRLDMDKEISLISRKIQNFATCLKADLSDREKARPVKALHNLITNSKLLITTNTSPLVVSILKTKLTPLEEFYNSYQLKLVQAEIKKINEGYKPMTTTTPVLRLLYLKYIELDPKCATVYFDLAKSLSLEETIILRNGMAMTKQKLLLKSIELDPDFAPAYSHLATTLLPTERIKVPYRNEMRQQQLLLRAIKLDPKDASAYHRLALTIPTQGVLYHKKACMTKQQLILKSLELDPTCAKAYRDLASVIAPVGSIDIPEKSIMARRGLALHREKSIKIPDGTIVTQQQLYLKSVDLDPSDSLAYLYLGYTLPLGGSIKLLNGCTLTRVELLNEDLRQNICMIPLK